MAFGDSRKSASERGEKKNFVSPFLKLTPGEHTIRVLDREETGYWQYWLMVNVNGKREGRGIIVGRNSPVKLFMDEIGTEDPRYQKPSRRFYINVLERTEVMRTDDGKIIYPNDRGRFIDVDDRGRSVAAVGDIAPSNLVKIWGFGNQILDLLTSLNDRMRSRRDPSRYVNLWDVDLLLTVVGEGKNKQTIPTQGSHPDSENPLPELLLNAPRYDLQAMTRPLPDTAAQALLDGEDYNEVMKSLGFTQDYPMITP